MEKLLRENVPLLRAKVPLVLGDVVPFCLGVPTPLLSSVSVECELPDLCNLPRAFLSEDIVWRSKCPHNKVRFLGGKVWENRIFDDVRMIEKQNLMLRAGSRIKAENPT